MDWRFRPSIMYGEKNRLHTWTNPSVQMTRSYKHQLNTPELQNIHKNLFEHILFKRHIIHITKVIFHNNTYLIYKISKSQNYFAPIKNSQPSFQTINFPHQSHFFKSNQTKFTCKTHQTHAKSTPEQIKTECTRQVQKCTQQGNALASGYLHATLAELAYDVTCVHSRCARRYVCYGQRIVVWRGV